MRHLVRFEDLTATSTKMAVLWDVAMCGQVDTERRLRGTYCLHLVPDYMVLHSRGQPRLFLFYK
jgi:hypothetical protein